MLPDYDCLEQAGYGVPELKEFSVHVQDGMLDLDFTAILECPIITALEIVPVSASP